MLFGGREDVDDATPYRKFPAPLDEVDAGVRGRGQAPGQLLEGNLVSHIQLHRLQVTESLDLRLQNTADGRDHHLQRTRTVTALLWVDEPTQYGQPAAHSVAAWAQPFVWKRLPRWVFGNGMLREEALQ